MNLLDFTDNPDLQYHAFFADGKNIQCYSLPVKGKRKYYVDSNVKLFLFPKRTGFNSFNALQRSFLHFYYLNKCKAVSRHS